MVLFRGFFVLTLVKSLWATIWLFKPGFIILCFQSRLRHVPVLDLIAELINTNNLANRSPTPSPSFRNTQRLTLLVMYSRKCLVRLPLQLSTNINFLIFGLYVYAPIFLFRWTNIYQGYNSNPSEPLFTAPGKYVEPCNNLSSGNYRLPQTDRPAEYWPGSVSVSDGYDITVSIATLGTTL